MKYVQLSDRQLFYSDCYEIISGKCRWAIDQSDLDKPESKVNLYCLICNNQNKSYVIPADIIKKYSKNRRSNKPLRFALPIDPNTDRIEYCGQGEDISQYCINRKTEIKLILNELNKAPWEINIREIERLELSIPTTAKKPLNLKGFEKDYDNKWDKEQYNIIREIQQRTTGEYSNKYKGAIVAEIIINYLRKYVPDNCILVGYNYFIQNNTDEFDAMIVTKGIEIVNKVYKPEDVKAIIEIKMSGFRGPEDADEGLAIFEKIQNTYAMIKCLIISARIHNSKQLRKFTNAFILSDWDWKINKYLGNWEILVNYIGNLSI